MHVVLDTNVFFSALISPHGAPAAIYLAWRAGKFDIITSQIQLDEMRRASRYPKFKAILQPSRVGTMINNLQHTIILESFPEIADVKDPHDAFLINMAIAGKVNYLVTGDHRAGILEKIKIQGTKILTPAKFAAIIL